MRRKSDEDYNGVFNGSIGARFNTVSYTHLDVYKRQQYYCECPAYQSYDGMCKHCVAVALEMMERDAEREEVSGEADRVSAAAPAVTPAAAARLKQPPTDTAVKKLIFASTIRENACYFQPEVNGNIRLVPILHRDAEGWMVEFKIGSDHLYVLKDITAMVNACLLYTSRCV